MESHRNPKPSTLKRGLGSRVYGIVPATTSNFIGTKPLSRLSGKAVRTNDAA